ncbi:hemopexin repeat-containing protein [Nocardia sp. NPDC127606]|uniref:hemopexin repeat-containing protein n=1 Tax=Nocardia sp. NPDC127606 TaxID=3345406 RepID=UPI0036270222
MTKVALRSGDWIYFFAGDQYIRVHRPGDTGAGTLDGGPSNISAWKWPQSFGRNGIDAAFRSGTKTYFFCGNQYIRVTRGATGPGTVDPGYPGNISGWGWPADFRERWSQIGSNFTFDNRITTTRRARLLEQHRRAYSQIRGCNHLNEEERETLIEAYHRPIRHGIETESIDASSCEGWNRIFVNFDVLFPKGDDAIAQTLIHEMMHVAGYPHPVRCTPERFDTRLCARVDRPMDGGTYFESAPLRAEKCIAGRQSDAECIEKGQRYALSFLSTNGVG